MMECQPGHKSASLLASWGELHIAGDGVVGRYRTDIMREETGGYGNKTVGFP